MSTADIEQLERLDKLRKLIYYHNKKYINKFFLQNQTAYITTEINNMIRGEVVIRNLVDMINIIQQKLNKFVEIITDLFKKINIIEKDIIDLKANYKELIISLLIHIYF